jgi:hypothetical protein
MNHRPRIAKLVRDPALEAEREVHAHRRRVRSVLRHRAKKRLDPAVKVAAVHVQNPDAVRLGRGPRI